MSPPGKALDQATRHLHREASFADPARTRDCNQAHILTQQKFFGGGHFFLPPHKSGPLHRKIRWTDLHLLNWLLRESVAYVCENRDVASRAGVRPHSPGKGNSSGRLFCFSLEPLQVRANIGGTLEALLAVFFQRPCEDCVHSGG